MRIDGRAALTLPEAAQWLGLTVPCVSALIARGELPSVRDPHGSVRISAAALIEWADRAGRGNPPTHPELIFFPDADRTRSAGRNDGE